MQPYVYWRQLQNFQKQEKDKILPSGPIENFNAIITAIATNFSLAIIYPYEW